MKAGIFKHTVDYYETRLTKLASETYDSYPDFPFGSKETIPGSDTIVEKSQGHFIIYRIESMRGIFQKSLTNYIADVSVDKGELKVDVRIKKTVLLFYFVWASLILSLIIYLISTNDFAWMLFAIMLTGASIHLPLSKRTFKKFVVQYLNSL